MNLMPKSDKDITKKEKKNYRQISLINKYRDKNTIHKVY